MLSYFKNKLKTVYSSNQYSFTSTLYQISGYFSSCFEDISYLSEKINLFKK